MSANTEQREGLNGAEKLWSVIQMLVGLITTVNLGLTSWALVAITGLQTDVASVKANRYTVEDAHLDTLKTANDILLVWKEISQIKESLSLKINAADVPPPHVVRWLERHDREIENLESKSP